MAGRSLGSRMLDTFIPPPPLGTYDRIPLARPSMTFGKSPLKPRINPTAEYFNSIFATAGIPPTPPTSQEAYILEEWINTNNVIVKTSSRFGWMGSPEEQKVRSDAIAKMGQLDLEVPGTVGIINQRFLAIAGSLFNQAAMNDLRRLKEPQLQEIYMILRKFYEITPPVGGKRRRNKSKKSKRKSRKTRRRKY